MHYTWRAMLKKYIEERYIHSPKEWYELIILTAASVSMTIVSERFTDMSIAQRREQVENLLIEIDGPNNLGFLSLFTPAEADHLGRSRSAPVQDTRVDNWLDLAHQTLNIPEHIPTPHRKQRTPRTVVFYSFKGSLGRTTALSYVAQILAMRGRKVVVVDLDVGAPSLSSLFHLKSFPQKGIVNYFYERSYIPKEVTPRIFPSGMVAEAAIPNAPGQLFVVPAGTLDFDYVSQVDDLHPNIITESGESLWAVFFRELTEQLRPDIILVDSQAGFSKWSAFSLLRAADQAMVFVYPDEQHKQGTELVLQMLVNKLPLRVVFSPVPSGSVWAERVETYWQDFQQQLETIRQQLNPGVNGNTPAKLGGPLTIHAIPELALGPVYPDSLILSNYVELANAIDENITATRLERVS